ncbi:hypothetical protein KI387_039084, partial [Taxus chinensis]
KAMFRQPRMKEVLFHEYALHLIHFHDNRFSSHPLFRYFLLNLIMRHRSQSTAAVFMQQNLENDIPPTIADLRKKFLEDPAYSLPDTLMR